MQSSCVTGQVCTARQVCTPSQVSAKLRQVYTPIVYLLKKWFQSQRGSVDTWRTLAKYVLQ